MKEFTGKGKSLDEARQRAANAAIGEMGYPDAMIKYELKSVKGTFGGIVGFDEVEVSIAPEVTNKKELCQDAMNLNAHQHNQTVLIIASGLHPTPGYTEFFQKTAIEIFPPEYVLYHIKPTGHVIQVMTPFSTSASFESADPVEEVVVHDAKGPHKVKVQQSITS